MDAFTKISGLLHNLLPSLQNAVDRVLVAKSHDYWNAYILKNLDPKNQLYWRRKGIDSVEALDLQCVIKVVSANFDIFKEACGNEYTERDLREIRNVRNDYAHDHGCVSAKAALAQLPIIRAFAKWMMVPGSKIALVDKVRNEIESSQSPRTVQIRVSKPSSASNIIPMTKYAITQKAADLIERLSAEHGLEFGRIIVKCIRGEDDYVLTKHNKSLFSLDLGKGYSAVLFNTANDDYIVVDLIPDTSAGSWFAEHSVNYDSVSGHIAISRVCNESEEQNVIEWSNDVPSDKASDGLLDLPDHGGGAVDYEPNSANAISLSETLKKNPDRREGLCVLDEELCKKLYDGTLENWQVYLHPEQLKAVTMDSEGPMMVKGPAGTGKTVVLVHRAKWLLENVFTNNERILITTFNKSLEYNIAYMLKSICMPAQLSRMDVVYFDQWLRDSWEKMGGVRVLFRKEDVEDKDLNKFLLFVKLAREYELVESDRSDEFIANEFDEIVQEYDIKDEATYLSAIRPKKSGVLRAEERRKLWKIFELANSDGLVAKVNPPVGISTRMRVINHVTKAIKSRKFGIAGKYAAVLIDESQDMGAAEYRLFGALTGNVDGHENPNSLMFAGDGHQRIYGRMGSLINCGINVRGGRTVVLKKCYRSSRALKSYAEKFLDGVLVKDMDDNGETFDGTEAIDEGVKPTESFLEKGNYVAMYDAIARQIREWMSVGSKRLSDYAILLREGNYKYVKTRHSKTWKLEKTAEAMCERGLRAVVVSSTEKYDTSDSIKVMTMHRAKGMQFYGVVINLDGWPHKPDKNADEEAKKENEESERRLIYMAIMRAVKFVMLTGIKGRPDQLSGRPISPARVQPTFNLDSAKQPADALKPKKQPVIKQGVLSLAPKLVSSDSKSDKEPTSLYDKFIAYLKATRRDYSVAMQYLRDIGEWLEGIRTSDEGKIALAKHFAGIHAKELEPAWSEFVKDVSENITLKEAAGRSILNL